MSRSKTSAAVLLTAALLAPPLCAGSLPSTANPILMGVDPSELSVADPARPFSGRKTPDLTIAVLLDDDQKPGKLRANGTEPTEVELRYYTPRGHLFLTELVPIGNGHEKFRRIDGFAHPVPVSPVQNHVHASKVWGRVDVTLPVGGTAISAFGLYGLWRLEVRLDENIIARASFRLVE